MPTVSVVVPAVRGGPYLREALDSVIAQTFQDWDLVVVDDGSDHGPAIRAAVPDDPRIRLVRQTHAGVSVARNRGLTLTDSRYVCFLDEDDIWFAPKLARQVDMLDEHGDSTACFTNLCNIDQRSEFIDEQTISVPADFPSLVTGIFNPGLQTVVVRRSAVMLVGGFNPDLDFAEDTDFIYRLAKHGHFCAVYETLSGYRVHPENATRNLERSAEGRINMLRIHGWSAHAHHDARATEAIEIASRDSKANYVREAFDRVIGEARHGHWKRAVQLLRWSVEFSALDTAREFGHRLHRLVTKRLP